MDVSLRESCYSERNSGGLSLKKEEEIQFYRDGECLIQTLSIPEDPTSIEVFAADELGRYIKKITGKSLKRSDHSEKKEDAGQGISLVLKRGEDWLSVSRDRFRKDSYSIRVDTHVITMKAPSDRSLLYAVYHLLEMMGCLWALPGSQEEFVPDRTLSPITVGESFHTPRIPVRGLSLYGMKKKSAGLCVDIIDWMAKNRFNLIMTSWDRPDPTGTQSIHWGRVYKTLQPEIEKRGLILDMSEHMTHIFFPKSLYLLHPRWFALVKGVRIPGQMCFSNPDGVEEFSRRAARFAAAHPEMDIMGTWPLDGGGYCECSGCQDPQAAYRAYLKTVEAVRQVRPDLKIEFLAYKPQTFTAPPGETDIPETALTLVCDRLDDCALDWSRRLEKQSGAYLFEYNMADAYRWAGNIWIRPDYSTRLMDSMEQAGYRGCVSLFISIVNWWRGALNYYCMGKAYWSESVDGAVEAYCRTYYQESAEKMQKVLDIVFEKLQNPELLSIYSWAGGDPGRTISESMMSSLQETAEEISLLIEEIEPGLREAISVREMKRLKAYIRFFVQYFRERCKPRNRRPSALISLTKKQDSVESVSSPSPRFLAWRFDKILRWEVDTDAGY